MVLYPSRGTLPRLWLSRLVRPKPITPIRSIWFRRAKATLVDRSCSRGGKAEPTLWLAQSLRRLIRRLLTRRGPRDRYESRSVLNLGKRYLPHWSFRSVVATLRRLTERLRTKIHPTPIPSCQPHCWSVRAKRSHRPATRVGYRRRLGSRDRYDCDQ